MSAVFSHLKRAASGSKPLLTNCLVYGSLCGLAEFSQQTLLFKVFPSKDQRRPYDTGSIFRYGVLGGLVLAPGLHYWYLWLDKVLPGTALVTVAKKTFIDVSLFAIPYYSAFYVLLNMMSGESFSEAVLELKQKLAPTMTTMACFWIPAQTINFRYVSPTKRIIFLAGCTFVEFNVLALFKKLEGGKLFVT